MVASKSWLMPLAHPVSNSDFPSDSSPHACPLLFAPHLQDLVPVPAVAKDPVIAVAVVAVTAVVVAVVVVVANRVSLRKSP